MTNLKTRTTSLAQRLRDNPALFVENIKPDWLHSASIYKRPDAPNNLLVKFRLNSQPEHEVSMTLAWFDVFAFCSIEGLGSLFLNSSTTKEDAPNLFVRWKSNGEDKQGRMLVVSRIMFGAEPGFIIKPRDGEHLNLEPDNPMIAFGPSKRTGSADFVKQMWQVAARQMETASDLLLFQDALHSLMADAREDFWSFRHTTRGPLDKEALLTTFERGSQSLSALMDVELPDGETVMVKLNEYLHNPADRPPLNEALTVLVGSPDFLAAPVGSAFVPGTQVGAIEALTKSYWASALERLLLAYPELASKLKHRLGGA